jgi:hypothetical protein
MHPTHPKTMLRARVAWRLATWVAWSLVALAVALGLGTLPLVVAVTRAASATGTRFPSVGPAQLQVSSLGWPEALVGLVACWAFVALGAAIVARSPAPTIGWIFCAVGVLAVVEPFTGYYALYALLSCRARSR